MSQICIKKHKLIIMISTTIFSSIVNYRVELIDLFLYRRKSDIAAFVADLQ